MQQWDLIYKNNSAKLLGVCRRYIKDEHLAEDLMHNAFVTAMNKVDTYSGNGAIEGWLRTIVINTVLLYLRNSKRNLFNENASLENYEDVTSDENEVSETQRGIVESAGLTKEDLLKAIDELPEHHKAVFNLYVIDEFKHKEIAEMLGISEGTSKSHLARARKKIQQLLYEEAIKKRTVNKKQTLFFFLSCLITII